MSRQLKPIEERHAYKVQVLLTAEQAGFVTEQAASERRTNADWVRGLILREMAKKQTRRKKVY